MKNNVAEILLRIGAVKVQPDKPFTFTSGMISPIYIDNRYVMSFPDHRKKIIDNFLDLIYHNEIEFDIIAGVATAGIHWAAWLAEKYHKPMLYIRGKAKGHGRQNQIEGKLEPGQKVLVIEDHISTGKSSVGAVEAVRAEGGVVDHCIAITTYEFRKARDAFKDADCNLLTLTDFTTLINKAEELGYIRDASVVLEWNKDPESWAENLN